MAYEAAAAGSHKDATTVRCDVELSLWHLVPNDSERGVKREALARLLNALVVGSNGDVHYYQVGAVYGFIVIHMPEL